MFLTYFASLKLSTKYYTLPPDMKNTRNKEILKMDDKFIEMGFKW